MTVVVVLLSFATQMMKEQFADCPIAKKEFEVELSILSVVNHPNIVTLLGAGSKPLPFLVLEKLQDVSHLFGIPTRTTVKEFANRPSNREELNLMLRSTQRSFSFDQGMNLNSSLHPTTVQIY